MKIDVEYITHLARLSLTEEEKDKFVNQLSRVLEYMNKLNEVDTKEVKPTAHVVLLKNVWRDDVVKIDNTFSEILSNAPAQENNFFKVKKVIE